jgi:hypothetical protein
MHSPDRVPTPPLSPAHRATDLFDREERGGSLRGGDRYPTPGARKKRSSTFAFVLLLAFVALLAPVVYHHQHKDHPDARRVRDERVVVTLDDNHDSANHQHHQIQRRQRLPPPHDATRGAVDDADGTETRAGEFPGSERDGVGGVGIPRDAGGGGGGGGGEGGSARRSVLSSTEKDDAAGIAGEMGSGSNTRKRREGVGR